MVNLFSTTYHTKIGNMETGTLKTPIGVLCSATSRVLCGLLSDIVNGGF